MKNIIKYFTCLLFLTVIFAACEKEASIFVGPDGTKPQNVSDVKIKPINGGAIISYKLPNENDLIGVQATYKLPSGNETKILSSLYDNQLMVSGLLDTQKATNVTLHTIDASGNKSEPKSISFKPLVAPVNKAEQTLLIDPTFGGVKFSFENPASALLTTSVYVKDTVRNSAEKLDSTYILVETKIYDSSDIPPFAIRGLSVKAVPVKVEIEDAWGNVTVKKQKVTPLFEEKIPKDKIKRYRLPHDVPVFNGEYDDDWDEDPRTWKPEFLFDDIIDVNWPPKNGFRTLDFAGSDEYDPDPLPIYANPFNPKKTMAQLYTVDLGRSVKLSRFLYHPVSTAYFRGAAWRIFDLYGTNETPNPDGSLDGWGPLLKEADVETKKPQNHTNKIVKNETIKNGLEFELDGQQVRYVRFAWRKNYLQVITFIAGEVSFYGKVVEETTEGNN